MNIDCDMRTAIVDGRMKVFIDLKYNPNHGPDGRFTSGGGRGGSGSTDPTDARGGGPFNEYHDDKKYPPANSNGVDTQQRFKKPDGTYTKERQALHDNIEKEYFEGKSPAEGQAEFLLMGGGSASGKSSVFRHGLVKTPDNMVKMDSDDIKGKLPEYDAMVKGKNSKAAAYAHEESSDISKQIMGKGLKQNYNTMLDGTGDSSLEKLKKKTDAARAAGHRVRAVYLTVDTNEAIRRSDARAEKSGRKVPHEAIRAIHSSVSRVVPQAIKAGLYDDFELWDNNAVGKPPKRIARAKGTKLEVLDEKAWAAFLAKGE